MSSKSFNILVSELERVDVFHNQSNNMQIPVKNQVLIALKCFGMYGNSMSLYKVID